MLLSKLHHIGCMLSRAIQTIRSLYLLLGAVLLLSGCGEINMQRLDATNQTQLQSVAVVSASGRDEQLFNRELRRLLYIDGSTKARYQLSSSISYSATSTLSVVGSSSTLKKASMSANFALVQLDTGKTVYSDSVTGETTVGAVTSLYGQDRSETNARERLPVLLAKKTVRQLQLYFLNAAK
jgi:hypothetical protein